MATPTPTIMTYGCESISIGEITTTGLFPTTGLVSIGATYKNSVDFVEAEPTFTDEFSDQSDDPVMTFVEKGSKTIKFSTFDYAPETLKVLKGGTVDKKEWFEPSAVEEIIKAVEIKTTNGLKIKFAKARITAKFNMKLVKNKLALIEVTIKPLAVSGEKSGTSFVKG